MQSSWFECDETILFIVGIIVVSVPNMASRLSNNTVIDRSFTVRTVYSCDVCGLEFGSQEDIIQHMDRA